MPCRTRSPSTCGHRTDHGDRAPRLCRRRVPTGIFAALLTDAVLANSAGGAGKHLWLGMEAWRWMFLAGVIPALAYGWIAYTLPESPRYLILQGKIGDARRIFGQLAPGTDVDGHVREIQENIKQDQLDTRKGSLRGPTFGLQSVVWIGIALSVLQQFVGINVIFYYSTTLWKTVGFRRDERSPKHRRE